MTPRRAFTLVEATVSVLIVGLVLVAAMRTAASSNMTQARTADRAAALNLALALADEITSLPYSDAVNLFGLEAGETHADRRTLNDADDYHGYSDSPPRGPDNDPLPGMSGWTRSVTVEWVTVADPTKTSAVPTGLKRITVTAHRKGVPPVRVTALRAKVP